MVDGRWRIASIKCQYTVRVRWNSVNMQNALTAIGLPVLDIEEYYSNNL